ncbi:hypothetical protein PGTUg99_012358 [Puccinia graminis f. sp. tritici]|uniref:Uncharacterized protein n=1 Tax=Puccinia graminis f. sp. tritici TaxID=56615 RepID=A0A5B0SJ73_PUCGR|nr:hypothetical protein PGTUg99_012358 [Puccinia graminis f. sp. tritici]
MEMSNIIFGDNETAETTFPESYLDPQSLRSPSTAQDDSSNPVENLEEINQNILFGITPFPASDDIPMTDHTSQPPKEIDTICKDLQAKLDLDPEHLKIATIAAKYPPEATAERASSIFAMGAFNQLSATRSVAVVANHVYDSAFREFVRIRTRMILLIPNLEAYSNNPHKHGVLAKTLFYLVLDAVDKQSDDWKEDHLDPAQMQPNSEEGLKHYRTTIGELIKYQRSHLRELLLTNILKTQKTIVKGNVPSRGEMLALIYADLPPTDKKMSKQQIEAQVKSNQPMQIRMSYARLVMVFYYRNKQDNDSQWTAIDDRLRILRTSSKDFQQVHAQLVMDKDEKLFSHKRHIDHIPKEECVVPTLDDVRAALAAVNKT